MKFLIRTDAYEDIGTGHLMRCLALAQGTKNHRSEVVFVTYCESKQLINRLQKEGFGINLLKEPGNLEESISIFKREQPHWVVLDGYHFDAAYQKAIKDAGYKLCVVDDYAHLDHYYADIILNQDYGAERFSYETEPYTRLLMGTRYVFLRREFLEYANFKREIVGAAKRVLITMGGVDLDNNTLKVLDAVKRIEFPLDVRVILGAGNLHCESIKQKKVTCRHNIEILTAVEKMAPLMAWADVAVSAGGTTVWELAFMGLPALLCIVAENQRQCVEALDQDGFFKSVKWVNANPIKDISNTLAEIILEQNLREEMSRKLRKLVDGRGADRVIKEIKSIAEGAC